MGGNFYFGWFLYNLINISLISLILYNPRVKCSPRILFNLIFCIAVFVLSFLGNSITQDHVIYKDIVDIVLNTKHPFVHIESFWILFIRYICGSYTNYLLILSFLLSSLLFINLQLLRPKNLVIFLGLFSAFSLYGFIGGRQGLFTALFILGVCLIGRRKYIFGICIVLASMAIHKVGSIAIIILLFCILPTDKNKTIIIMGLIFLGAFVIRHILENNAIELFVALENTPGSSYLLNETDPNATGSALWKILPLIRTIVLFIVGTVLIIKINPLVHSLNFENLIFYKFLFWCLIISGGLYLINLPDPTIANRTFSLMTLPLAYTLSNLEKYVGKIYYYQPIVIIPILISLIINNLFIYRVGLTLS